MKAIKEAFAGNKCEVREILERSGWNVWVFLSRINITVPYGAGFESRCREAFCRKPTTPNAIERPTIR